MKKYHFVLLSTLILTLLLTACTTPASKETPSSIANADAGTTSVSAENTDSEEKEAPMLAEKVAAGELPALEERLPVADDIMIEPDVISTGKYGGSITLQSTDNERWNWGTWTEQSMFRFKQDGSGEVEANVCKDFYPNEDSSVWTILLREGMRWSDGEPFTADDIIFYYDHMSTPALREDRSAVGEGEEGYYSAYTSKPYNCYQVDVDGVKYWAEFAKVSDYELTVTFAAPKPTFAADVAIDNKWMFLPKHFYINYVSRKDGVEDDTSFPFITEEDALASANRDFGKQWESYSTMAKDIGYYHWDYAIVPQVRSFIAVKDNWNAVGETYTLVRNPYFWKTDSEGRQLPYLDSLEFLIVNEVDQRTLNASAGVYDWYYAEFDYSTIATNVQNTHTIVLWSPGEWASNNETLQLNMAVKDLDKRELFNNIKFREALSIAVDRNLLNEVVRNGSSGPWQASPNRGMPAYDEEWSAKWTEYDVDKANALLDEITEPWDGTDGTYRKMKGTNKDAEIIVSVKEPSESADFFSIIQAAYKAVGVKLVQKVDADLRTTMLSNDVEAALEGVGTISPALRPDSIVPVRNVQFWYSAYGKWYEDGKTEAGGGIEPAGDIMALVEAYDTINKATGANRDEIVAENVQKIYDLHKENIWVIGYLEPLAKRNIKSNRLQNVPENIVYADEYRFNNLARPEQFWVSE